MIGTKKLTKLNCASISASVARCCSNRFFYICIFKYGNRIKRFRSIVTETPSDSAETFYVSQFDFDKVTQIVRAEFQIEEALVENNVPTYRLKQPQETKKPFLKLLKNLEPMNLIALLRRIDGNVILKVLPKPLTKKSNVLVNWLLFFATIATTFVTGYMLSADVLNPWLGGAAFTLAIMAVLGGHEMSHKLTEIGRASR